MRFKYASYRPEESRMDMTPIIDIVFNLLLFFLLSSSYVQHSSIDISLPEAATAQPIESKFVLVELRRDERIFLDGRELPYERLKDELRMTYAAGDASRPLIIRADQHAFHGHVVAILDAAREIGVKSLNIETLPLSDATKPGP